MCACKPYGVRVGCVGVSSVGVAREKWSAVFPTAG